MSVEQLAIDRHNKARKELDEAEEQLVIIFSKPVDRLLAKNRFQDAKEYLRRFPDSGSKVLMFHKILLLQWKAAGELCEHNSHRPSCDMCQS